MRVPAAKKAQKEKQEEKQRLAKEKAGAKEAKRIAKLTPEKKAKLEGKEALHEAHVEKLWESEKVKGEQEYQKYQAELAKYENQ